MKQVAEVCFGCGIAQSDCDVAVDGTGARRKLSEKLYDVLIVDLTLPHISGRDEPTYAVADALLSEIFLLDNLRAPGDVIGITRDVEAITLVATSIGAHVMAVIEERPDGAWKAQLADKLNYVSRASLSRQSSFNSQSDYDVLLITALDVEMQPFRTWYDMYPSSDFEGAQTFGVSTARGNVRKGVAFSIGKSGEARAASATQSLLSAFRPKLVLMSGICGGVESKTAIGDVIIAESAIDWDYGRWEDEQAIDPSAEEVSQGGVRKPVFLSRPDPVSIFDTALHRVVRDLLSRNHFEGPDLSRELRQQTEGRITRFKFHPAPMASGSAVIATEEITRRIRGLNESIRGIDMECFGVYLAVEKTRVKKPQVMCVKAIADHCNGMKNSEWHRPCSDASFLVTREIMNAFLEVD